MEKAKQLAGLVLAMYLIGIAFGVMLTLGFEATLGHRLSGLGWVDFWFTAFDAAILGLVVVLTNRVGDTLRECHRLLREFDRSREAAAGPGAEHAEVGQ